MQFSPFNLISTFFLVFNGLIFSSLHAQLNVVDFENLQLNSQSFYIDSTGKDFTVNNISFEYDWNKTWKYWSSGFSYTNITDSTTSGSGNLYACKAFKGHNNSNYYVTAKDGATLRLTGPEKGKTVTGFYIANSTYAANSMKSGDAFSKKFGGATGNDPDWFKVTIFAYQNGIKKTDSVEYYLADFRYTNNSQDYILNSWKWLDLTKLGNVDSINFKLSSSDNGLYGMNTPAFFCMDNFTTDLIIGLKENNNETFSFSVFPNPANNHLSIVFNENLSEKISIQISDLSGRNVFYQYDNLSAETNSIAVNIASLHTGVYFLRININNKQYIKKFIKND